MRAPKLGSGNGVATVISQSGPRIEVLFNDATNGAVSCAIALLEHRDGELVISREVRHIRGAQHAVDRAHGWK